MDLEAAAEAAMKVLTCPACVRGEHPRGNDLFMDPTYGLMSCDCICHPINQE